MVVVAEALERVLLAGPVVVVGVFQAGPQQAVPVPAGKEMMAVLVIIAVQTAIKKVVVVVVLGRLAVPLRVLFQVLEVTALLLVFQALLSHMAVAVAEGRAQRQVAKVPGVRVAVVMAVILSKALLTAPQIEAVGVEGHLTQTEATAAQAS